MSPESARDDVRPGRDPDDVDFRDLARRRLVGAADALPEGREGAFLDEGDDAAPEARAHHPRPEDALDEPGRLHQDVELRRGDLVVVAEPGVGGGHELPELPEIPLVETDAGLLDPDVLADDVITPLEDRRVELRSMLLEQVQADVPEAPDGGLVRLQDRDALLALPPPDIVLGRGQLPPDHGIGDDDPEVGFFEREIFVGERAAIELEDGILPAVDDDRVFKALADPSRRLLLDRLFERDGRTLGDLASQVDMTRFGVMKHLRVLEEAGLVVSRKVGRTRLHHLNPVPIRQIHDRWIDKYTEHRAASLAALKTRLEERT